MKLRIDSVEARTDGTGTTALDVWALQTVDGVDVEIPGMHRTVLLDSAAVNTAMALPTAPQRVAALKTLITTAVQEMQDSALITRVAANTASTTAANALTSAYTFPVKITL